jgi:hypothetical protein
MTVRPGLQLAPAFVAALVLACASGPAGGPPPEGAPAATGLPTPGAIATQGGMEAAGRSLAQSLSARFSGYWSGRVAVGWDSRQGWLRALGEGFALRWHSAVLLTDMGAVAHSEDQAFIQLDPSSFAGLLWISPEVSSQGELVALDLSLTSTQGRPAERLRLECSPALALRSGAAPASEAPPALLVRLPGPVRALFCSAEGELWVALPDQVERLGGDGRPLQTWDLGPPSSSPGRAVLGNGEEGGTPEQVGFFDLGRGTGWWFRREASGPYVRGEAIRGYPLAERLQRFFSAPFDPASNAFQVQDFQGKPLATAAGLTRFQGPSGSLFGLLGTEGGLSILDGSRLAVLPGPSLQPVAALAGYGKLLFDATSEPPFVVRAHLLSPSGAWQTAWTSAPFASPVTSLSAGLLKGGFQVFAGVRETDGTGAVYAMEGTRLTR